MEVKGNPVSPGIAIGESYIYKPFSPVINKSLIAETEIAPNLIRYNAAKDSAAAELNDIVTRMEKDDPEKAKIFVAHQDILSDVALEEEIQDLVNNEHLSADYAVFKVYEKFIVMFGELSDEMFRERAADLKDVRNRLLRCWAGIPENNLATLDKPYIIVAEDLFPSDTATLDREKVLAILTEMGGPTSHSAIIARSYEIPAVLGVPGLMTTIKNGKTIVVDAITGRILLDPSQDDICTYAEKRNDYLTRAQETKRYLDVKPMTADGVSVEVHLNIGSASEQELAGSQYTDGVGLFRTEIFYMETPQLPTEDAQFDAYKKVLSRYGERPITLRTLDIGGDKKLDCLELPVEENPFLGNRALRLCFSNPDIFKTQLRAALRASVYGNLWIMLPMVASLDDIRHAKAYVEEAKAELNAQGIPYNPNYKLGIMVEIPSIALIADLAAKEVDFASIGSNDLCQYMTAVDRLNPVVAKYYQTYHPAMFRLIGYVVEQFKLAGKPVSICGEMGGDPLSAAVLVGLGMRKLSMGFASVAPIKKMLAGLTIEKAQCLAKHVVTLPTAADVESYLREELKDLL